MNSTALNCSSCNAPLTPGALRCDYCGNATPAAAALGRQRPVTTVPLVHQPVLERYTYAPSERGPVRLGTAFPAVMRCFARYIGFSGRASLAEYWWWVVLHIGVFWFLIFASVAMGGTERSASVTSRIWLWWCLLTLIPGWAVTVRRLHDVRRSGWNAFLLLTLVGAIPVLYWVSLPSDAAPNNPWGPPDPI